MVMIAPILYALIAKSSVNKLFRKKRSVKTNGMVR
jgi:hypothetical protein